MNEQIMFEINFLELEIKNFNEKKSRLLDMLKAYPEKRLKNQNFLTNRQSDRNGMAEKFEELMMNEIKNITENLKCNFKLQDIWSITYEVGDYHPVHNHGGIGLTGLLYLQTNENCSPTYCLQPWNDHMEDKTIYRKLPSKEGTIVIFPKFINHFTEPHDGDLDKKVIAFDFEILEKK